VFDAKHTLDCVGEDARHVSTLTGIKHCLKQLQLSTLNNGKYKATDADVTQWAWPAAASLAAGWQAS